MTVAVGMILAGCFQNLIPEPGIPRMTKEELKPLMGTPGVIILDVREPDDWNKSREKIAGAVREDPEKDAKMWAEKYPKDKTLVFY
jgi:rhodanese-related sulfurtransferase